jgi:hypothetical protein
VGAREIGVHLGPLGDGQNRVDLLVQLTRIGPGDRADLLLLGVGQVQAPEFTLVAVVMVAMLRVRTGGGSRGIRRRLRAGGERHCERREQRERGYMISKHEKYSSTITDEACDPPATDVHTKV